MIGNSVNGRFFLFLILMIILLSACENNQNTSQSEEPGNPAPKDLLEKANADIFVLGDIVYANAENVQWVKELNYSIGEQVAEISKQTDHASGFNDGSANKLPVGTKIFETNTAVYIAMVGNKEIPYLKMIEG